MSTEARVRRAVAIQMIINKELGLNFCENPWQGSFTVDQLTDLVEEAVYRELEAISKRGGVLGAMDTMYKRGKIQEESLYYEHKKHDGSLPLVGVNMFLPREHGGEVATEIELIRSTEEERGQQIANPTYRRGRRRGIHIPGAKPDMDTWWKTPRGPMRCMTGRDWRIFRTRRREGGMCSRHWWRQ